MMKRSAFFRAFGLLPFVLAVPAILAVLVVASWLPGADVPTSLRSLRLFARGLFLASSLIGFGLGYYVGRRRLPRKAHKTNALLAHRYVRRRALLLGVALGVLGGLSPLVFFGGDWALWLVWWGSPLGIGSASLPLGSTIIGFAFGTRSRDGWLGRNALFPVRAYSVSDRHIESNGSASDGS